MTLIQEIENTRKTILTPNYTIGVLQSELYRSGGILYSVKQVVDALLFMDFWVKIERIPVEDHPSNGFYGNDLVIYSKEESE